MHIVPRLLAAASLISLAACHGVDPLLASPPPPTRPDAVLRTPSELRAALDSAARDVAVAKRVFAVSLWSDGLSQSPQDFRQSLERSRPDLAVGAPDLQPLLGNLFTQAADLDETGRQIRIRLDAMDEIRRKTGFVAHVEHRKDLYNRRSDALREAYRYGGQASRYDYDAAVSRARATSTQVDRIDYVNSAGRVVESKYTAAYAAKQNARAILPFQNAAAREMAEKANAEAEKAQALAIVIAGTENTAMDRVEARLFSESDRVTGELWPQLEQIQKKLQQTLAAFEKAAGPNAATSPASPTQKR